MPSKITDSEAADIIDVVGDADVAEFVQAIGLLIRRIRAVTATHELSLSEGMVLGRLAKDGPATTAELARAEAVRPQSMGATIGALEERGFVERTPHPTDGRQMNISLTEKGAEVRQSSKDAKLTWLAQAIARLNEGEREALFAAGKIINRLVQQ
jgi:DNA-binding MarR family transcriptional regulator